MKAGWTIKPLGEVCDVVNAGTPKPDTSVVPVLRLRSAQAYAGTQIELACLRESKIVVPAYAGTQDSATLDSRIRGNDEGNVLL